MTTVNQMQAEYTELTGRLTGILAEIRRANPETLSYAIEDFRYVDRRRVELMGLLGLIPA